MVALKNISSHVSATLNKDGATNKIFTIPNFISFIRLLLVPLFAWCIVMHYDILAVILIILSSVSDFLDGFIARRFKQVTKVGKILDPIADRLFIFVLLIMLVFRSFIPSWTLAAMFLREALLFFQYSALILNKKDIVPVNIVGKIGAASLLFSMPLIFFCKSDIIRSSICTSSDICSTSFLVFENIAWFILVIGLFVYWSAGIIYTVKAIHELKTCEQTRLLVIAALVSIIVAFSLIFLVLRFVPLLFKTFFVV
ncbi:MAG: CDP-alcohol phosphatidyltransferase family protein [Candidatus Ancillula sp.]|jgi:cardiolipin synthase|nr:CDP-alcohol phosphatidyltransferase family protein [Candidatus Ancillula sp.]